MVCGDNRGEHIHVVVFVKNCMKLGCAMDDAKDSMYFAGNEGFVVKMLNIFQDMRNICWKMTCVLCDNQFSLLPMREVR